ncbi:MAG: hypothetical protein Q7T41_00915 [Candidatus Saccharibacteria bacterium]|nr:hypothetical protein [Candidatus Saccharibacteria bacterium]
MAEKKIIDVASAADSKVDIGSKPMIIGHKSMATDPMVREKQEEELVPTENAPKDEQEKTPESKSEIEPPSAKQKALEPIADSNTEKQVDADDKSVASKPDTEPDKKEEEPSGEEKKVEELDPVALQMEKDEKIRELISSKKYFVGIKQASSGGFKKWIYAFLLTMLLALAGLFVLIDSGTLDIGVKLPFTIFDEEKQTVNTESTSPEQVDVVSEDKEIPIDDQTVDSSSWYNFSTIGYSMFIPDGWSLMQKEGNTGSLVDFGAYEYKEGQLATVLDYDKTLPAEAMFTFILDNNEISDSEACVADSRESTSSGSFNTIGKKIVQWRYFEGTKTETERALGELVEGEKQYEYCLSDANREIRITYTVIPAMKDEHTYLESGIKTITFTE